MKAVFEDIRSSQRKRQQGTVCLVDDDDRKYNVYELSSDGFSFLCPDGACNFQKWQTLHCATILNSEGVEIISAAGTVAHVTNFDSQQKQVGVHYTRKSLDRTISGRIRVPRKYPRIRLKVFLKGLREEVGIVARGYLMDYTASTARIGLTAKPKTRIELGDEFGITISANEKDLLDGHALVIRKKDDESEIILSFSGELLDIEYVETVSNAIENQKSIHSTIESISEFDEIPSDFKALINDWRIFFTRTKNALDQIDAKRMYQMDWEQELFIKEIENKFIDHLNPFIEGLNSFADNVKPRERLTYKKYFRENLNSFIRMSPIAASMIDKDQGYSGDFETIKRFFQNPYVGDSLWSKLMSKYICSTGAVLAHQDRIDFLYDRLTQAFHGNEHDFSFLTLGSGPAEEILRFIAKHSFEQPISATLLDMDAFALADFSNRLQYLAKENFTVELINLNIMSILRKNIVDPVQIKFAMTYCAGLFDYLSDGICRKLTQYLLDHTLPGGKVILTNVHKNNFTRNIMDYSFEWEIIHRDEDEMRRIAPPDCDVKLEMDNTMTNIYMTVMAPS